MSIKFIHCHPDVSNSHYISIKQAMNWIWFFLCFAIAHSKPTDFKKTYQIIFPGGETFSYAKLYGTIDRPLNDFTLCHWSRTNSKEKDSLGYIFSYFSTLTDNSILTAIIHNKEVTFRRDQGWNSVQINIPETEWLQTCSTWSVVGNSWQIFVNGERIGYGNWSSRKIPIQSNGVVVLGQDQDTKEGGFDVKGSFIGQISELHLWDYILTPSEIIQVSRCNNPENGNIIDWNEDSWVLHNGARISLVRLPCGQPQ